MGSSDYRTLIEGLFRNEMMKKIILKISDKMLIMMSYENLLNNYKNDFWLISN